MPGRRRPEMPDTIGTLAYPQNHRSFIIRPLIIRIRHGHRVMRVRTEPWKSPVQASAHLSAVIVQHRVFSIYSARELCVCNFNLRLFVTRHTRICDGDAPQHRRVEITRLARGIYVARFEANLRRDAGIVGRLQCDRANGNSHRHPHPRTSHQLIMIRCSLAPTILFAKRDRHSHPETAITGV